MEPIEKYPLTPELLFNLTGGRDFIGPLQKFNVPMQVLLVVFEVITPVSLTLNFFVFFSCIAILIRKTSDRPALIFIAYNALLDVFIITSDHIVMTGAANPPLGDVPIGGVLPDEEELTRRCSVEKGEAEGQVS